MSEKKLLGVFEPVFNGKHVSDMTDEEVDEFADWLYEQTRISVEEN